MKGLSAKKDSTRIPLLLAYLGNIILGFSFLFVKIAQRSAPSSVLLSHRFIVACVIMLLLVAFRVVKVSFRNKNWWPAILLLSFQYLYYVFESKAIIHTNATLAGAGGAVSPVVSIILAAIFLKEFPTKRQTIFCLFPIAGVIMMTLAGKELGVVTAIGAIFLALTILSAGSYKTVNRKAAQQFTAFERTVILFVFSSVSFTITALQEIHWDWSAYLAPLAVPSYTVSMLILAVFCSLVSNLMINYATAKLPVVKISSLGALVTLVSLLAGVILLGEPWDYTLVLGAVLVILGLWQVTKVPKKN